MACCSNGLKNPDARRDLGLKFAGGHSYVVLGLKVDPKTRLHAEIDTQAQRSVGRDGPLAVAIHAPPFLINPISE